MASNKPYQTIPTNKLRRSIHDLSYRKLFNCDMGQLIPVLHDEVVPGDIFNIGNEMVIRMQPLVAPVLHEINAYVHYFFVPYRILWDGWEEFITGGVDGDDASTIPLWQVSSGKDIRYSLWDYFGFPANNSMAPDYYPIDFPRRCYAKIYNEWYRDQTLQTEVAETNEDILYRNWEKDYFTSALPWQQRGTAPALPISGLTAAIWEDALFSSAGATVTNDQGFTNTASDAIFRTPTGGSGAETNAKNFFNANTVDMSNATTFDVNDLRLVFSIQKWLERNARSGARYIEFLQSHFAGVSPKDERLQRPEYIGGTQQPIIISEVLQTSETATSPQGNLAGHGISADSRHAGTYRVEEYGIIMGIMSIMPRANYSQGINRQWLRETRYDYYFPEFANLGEQAVTNAELFYTFEANTDKAIFGYQGRYDEMRTKQDLFCADMRDTFQYWHLGRIFSSTPSLNSDFVKCNPRKDIFAVTDEPGFIVHHKNLIQAVRPIPIQSEPGLIDH